MKHEQTKTRPRPRAGGGQRRALLQVLGQDDRAVGLRVEDAGLHHLLDDVGRLLVGLRHVLRLVLLLNEGVDHPILQF